MKNSLNRYTLSVVCAVLIVIGCTSRKIIPAPADSQYLERRATELYEKAPERALALIDSAEQTGTMPNFRADLLRAKLFTLSTANQRQDVALQIAEGLLSHDSVKGNALRQQEVLQLLLNASRMRHDDEQSMRWATQYTNLLNSLGNESAALRTEAEIGLIMTHLGQVSEGMQKIDHAIARLDAMSGFNAMLAYILASKRKITVLRETGQHADIPDVAQAIQAHLDKMLASPNDYIDGSQHAPKDEEQLEDYCDFYGAQATAFKAAAYANLGDNQKARQQLAIFRETNYGHTLDGRKMIAPTLGKLGDYTSMLAIYDKAEAELEGDTLRQDYADILLARAEAAEAQGRIAASLSYRKRYEALVHSLNERLHRNQSHDYAARYHAQEQQMEIQRQKAEISLQNIFLIMGAVIMVLACAFAVYFFRQKRYVDYKNHILVEQMTGAIDYKQKYEEAMQAAEKKASTQPPATPTTSSPTTEADDDESNPDLNALTDEQLFQHISEVILREKLHLKPVCDRQTITSRFGLTEKRVGAAFAKGSNYKSLASFVRDSRLEYAAQLLRQHPEMTIGEVATASGFASHTRFTADFKTRYSVSPTEFRTMAK